MRAILLAAIAIALASAETIKWTGIANDNQWTNHINWYPDKVPGQNDDVHIPSGNVVCTIATAVNSLTMGYMATAPANLTLYQAFVIGNGGMTVEVNGNLIVQTGLQQVFGQVTIGGYFDFVDGVLGGSWTILSKASANLGNSNERGLSSCTFLSQGSLSLGGVLLLNQSSTFTLASNTVSNSNLQIRNGDGSAVLFDASQATYTYSVGTLIVQAPVKLGNFVLQSGNITILNPLTFEQSLNVPAGSLVAAFGNAVVNMTAGLTGAGVVSFALASTASATLANVAFSGAINLNGGPAIFSGASSMGILTIDGGNVVFNAAVYPTQFNLLTGTTSGSGMVTASNVYIKTKGFTLGSSVSVNSTASFMGGIFTFGMEGAFTVMAGARATVSGALSLTGPAFIAGLVNNGELQCTDALASQNIDITGSGTVTVASTLSVNTAKVSQASVTLASGTTFSGQHTFLTIGKVVSATGGDVKAVIGDYRLTCKAECDNVSTPGATTPTSDFSFSA